MARDNLHPRYFGFKTDRDANFGYEPQRSTLKQLESSREDRSQPETASTSAKQPSKLGILILAIATIALYSFGIKQLSETGARLIESAIRVDVRDYSP